jgi:MFS family permease
MSIFKFNFSFSHLKKINKVVLTFIVSDFFFWSGWSFVSPIFAVFVVQKVVSANLFIVGAAASIYFLTKAITEIPIALYLDKKEGEKDDFYALILGLFLVGITALLFLSVRTVTALFLVMILQGIAFALYSVAWPSIFSRHLDRGSLGFEWALNRFAIDFISAFSALFSGGISLIFGFDAIFILAALLAFVSAGVLFLVPNIIIPKGNYSNPFLFKKDDSSRIGQ